MDKMETRVAMRNKVEFEHKGHACQQNVDKKGGDGRNVRLLTAGG